MFDPSALTIGFARRVEGYKRWNLLLTDPQRLLSLINNEERPVQFVFAGKAHPQDEGSKSSLQQLAQWKYDPAVRQRAVFLEDYEQEVVPLFYARDDKVLPREWIAMMKRAVQTLAPKYNSNRMVEEYIRKIFS